MGCNCGDNEYNITVNNNGNCEPTTPIYNITLANVGVNGYSPIVRFINETVESFNIAVDNITGTETSPAVPKLSYVANQINDVYNTISGLGSTYLTKDGSNAANPIVLNHLTMGYQYGSPYINSDNNLYIRGSVISLQATNDINLSTTGTNKAYYNNKEIATVDQLPTVGNGTITITQGGVSKGTFTTNQSGNTTIELDEGGGITNPLLIENTNGRQLSLGINNSTNKASMSYQITGGIFISTPVYLIGDKANPITLTEDSFGLYTIGIAYDTTTLGLNANNELTVINAGTSYTAGNGIDITNNVISVDESDLDFLSNEATGTSGLVISGTSDNGNPYVTALGIGSYAGDTSGTAIGSNTKIYGYGGIAIGASVTDYGDDNIAIGGNCGTNNDTVEGAIQLGNGTNTISNSLCVGGNYNLSTSEYDNWELLDRATGKIPNDRINTMVGATTLTGGSAGLVPAPTTSDVGKFLKSDGTWDTVGGGGGGSYTAGTGIDITNDTISVDSTILTTNTAQTITAIKTFTNYIKLQNILRITTNGGGVVYDQNGSFYNMLKCGNYCDVGDSGVPLSLYGSNTRPNYNSGYLALYSDIPTVNNSTITFTQGGVTKGTITLNQSSNQTIELDAGGGTPSNMVTTDTTQTISGTKTFSSETHHTGVITFDSALATPIIRGMSGASYRNMIYRTNSSSSITVGNSNDTIDLKGSGTRPTYNSNNLALYSDIPIVNDTTPSTTTVYSSQKTQELINALTARIMVLEANINGGNA